VRAAFELNLLTKDNLPSHPHEIAVRFGPHGAWGSWVHRWTAEEARHAAAIRDYLIVSRAVDPVALERDRMRSMAAPYTADGKNLLRSLAYVSLQELATRIAHRNTGRMAGDPAADRLLARIAVDENLQMAFYRDLVGAALELAPEQAIEALAAEDGLLREPGYGIPGFLRRALQIAEAGIYAACPPAFGNPARAFRVDPAAGPGGRPHRGSVGHEVRHGRRPPRRPGRGRR